MYIYMYIYNIYVYLVGGLEHVSIYWEQSSQLTNIYLFIAVILYMSFHCFTWYLVIFKVQRNWTTLTCTC